MKDLPQNSTTVLCWPKKLLSADDLRRHLTSQRELLLLPRTIITPLAADELRAKKVKLTWQATSATPSTKQNDWCYALEKPDALILSAINALERDGLLLNRIEFNVARKFAASMSTGQGGIVFCDDPATWCCIVNKIAGIRAVSVLAVRQIVRAQKHLGANFYAIEIPGPTFFELRQMLKAIVSGVPACPVETASLLKELDGHAHR
jgi:hypothetical protein